MMVVLVLLFLPLGCLAGRNHAYFALFRRILHERVDKSQQASASISAKRYPAFLILAVLVIKYGNSQRVQYHF